MQDLKMREPVQSENVDHEADANQASLHTNDNRSSNTTEAQTKKTSTSKVFIDLIVCIIIPTIILKKLSAESMAGPTLAFALAISLPLFMAIYEFIADRKVSLMAALGFISILMTGGIGLLKLPKDYIAIKEALIPGVLAAATIISAYTKHPLIRTFVYNDMMMDTQRVSSILAAKQRTAEFDAVMVRATLILASAFTLSAFLNYGLAKYIIVSETGSEAFNSELGTMNLLSYPVIVVPCMIVMMYTLYYVIKNIKRLTDLKLEEIVNQ